MRPRLLYAWPLLLATLLAGCQTVSDPPPTVVDDLDLQRFMGDWYVVANIPTFIEEGAHNALESYRLDDKGRVQTTFRFRQGGFDGDEKVYRPTGYVSDDNNAVWGMQFLWPFKAEFLVLYVDDDYRHTVIGRSARDYVWLMAREPAVSGPAYSGGLRASLRSGTIASKVGGFSISVVKS